MVEIKDYPEYREAVATKDVNQFRTLFSHISKHDLPMTTPVETRYSDAIQMTQMSFLYPSTKEGKVG